MRLPEGGGSLCLGEGDGPKGSTAPPPQLPALNANRVHLGLWGWWCCWGETAEGPGGGAGGGRRGSDSPGVPVCYMH